MTCPVCKDPDYEGLCWSCEQDYSNPYMGDDNAET